MAIVFDGKRLASEIENRVAKRVAVLKKKGITPKLETILDGDNPASVLYVKLKEKAAKRVGVDFGVYPIAKQKRNKRLLIKSFIRKLNEDLSIHGVMVQLPLSHTAKRYTKEILAMIDPKKDVDGHLEESSYDPAVVSAIMKIISEARQVVTLPKENSQILAVVVGSKGSVGRALERKLKAEGFRVRGIDNGRGLRLTVSAGDIVISATGKPGLIKDYLVKPGAVVIDAGAPKGDVDFDNVSKKASFITPVPGGVGPVTVACLMENLVNATFVEPRL